MAKKSLVVKAKRKTKYKVRQYNRCPLCGRSRGYLRKFKMCRICLESWHWQGRYLELLRQAGKKIQSKRKDNF